MLNLKFRIAQVDSMILKENVLDMEVQTFTCQLPSGLSPDNRSADMNTLFCKVYEVINGAWKEQTSHLLYLPTVFHAGNCSTDGGLAFFTPKTQSMNEQRNKEIVRAY